MSEKQNMVGNPKKGKVLRNVGIISAIGAVIMLIVRIYFNVELNKAENSSGLSHVGGAVYKEVTFKVGSEEMTKDELIDFANEIISKCTIAMIVMAVIAVVLIVSYIMMNKKKSDQ